MHRGPRGAERRSPNTTIKDQNGHQSQRHSCGTASSCCVRWGAFLPVFSRVSDINSPPEMSATVRDRAFDEMSREHPARSRRFSDVLGTIYEVLKYSYITSTVLLTDDNAVGLRSGVGAVLERC